MRGLVGRRYPYELMWSARSVSIVMSRTLTRSPAAAGRAEGVGFARSGVRPGQPASAVAAASRARKRLARFKLRPPSR